MKNRPKTKESLLERYNCGPVKLSGDSNAFYERHIAFDQVVAETETTISIFGHAINSLKKYPASTFNSSCSNFPTTSALPTALEIEPANSVASTDAR